MLKSYKFSYIVFISAFMWPQICQAQTEQSKPKAQIEVLTKNSPLVIEAYNGDPKSQFLLGSAFRRGEGVKENRSTAIDWFTKAAEQGYVPAQSELGMEYGNFSDLFGGRDGSPDIPNRKNSNQLEAVTSAIWYIKAAEQGHLLSQHMTGLNYQHGQGLPRNYKESANWYRKAAISGYARSQLNLGVMYDRGLGVKKNKAIAASWFREAAMQGAFVAQFYLAQSYYKGSGVPVDYIKAYQWFDVSKKSLPEAEVFKKELARVMSPKQVEKAQKLSVICTESKFKNC